MEKRFFEIIFFKTCANLSSQVRKNQRIIDSFTRSLGACHNQYYPRICLLRHCQNKSVMLVDTPRFHLFSESMRGPPER